MSALLLGGGWKKPVCAKDEVYNPVERTCIAVNSAVGKAILRILNKEDSGGIVVRSGKKTAAREWVSGAKPAALLARLKEAAANAAAQAALAAAQSPEDEGAAAAEAAAEEAVEAVAAAEEAVADDAAADAAPEAAPAAVEAAAAAVEAAAVAAEEAAEESPNEASEAAAAAAEVAAQVAAQVAAAAYPRASEWPDVEDPGFRRFVGDLLTNNLPNRTTQDYTLPPAPRENGCAAAGGPLQLEKYQAMLTRLIGPDSPLKRMLFIASTGSGKTCALHALAAAQGYTVDPYSKLPKIVVIVPGAGQANEIWKQSFKCPGPIREWVEATRLDWNKEGERSKIQRYLNTCFEVMTYVQAGNRLKRNGGYFDDRVVFMDEVHNLVDAPVEKDGHLTPTFERVSAGWRKSVETLYKKLGGARNATIVGLTATPIVDRPEQLLMLVNVLAGKQLINPDTFMLDYVTEGKLTTDEAKLGRLRAALTGILAIYDNKNDVHRFPDVDYENVKVAYSQAQAAKIRTAKKPASLVNADPWSMRKAMMEEWEDDEALAYVSPKLAAVLEKITELDESGDDGKQIVFSDQQRTGAVGLLELLQQRGHRVHPAHGEKGAAAPARNGIIFLGNTPARNMTKKMLETQLRDFNAPGNAYGEQYGIAILSSKFAEGVDFKGVRAIHILEELADPGRFEQVVGRARRFCSHRELAYPDEWKVKVITYTAAPTEEQLGQAGLGDAKKRKALKKKAAKAALKDAQASGDKEQVKEARAALKAVDEMVLQGAPGFLPQPDVDNARLRASKMEMKDALLSLAGSVALDCKPNQARTGFVCDTGDAAYGVRQAPAEAEAERPYKVHTDMTPSQAEQRAIETKGGLLRELKDGSGGVMLTVWIEKLGTVRHVPVKINRREVTVGKHVFVSLAEMMAKLGLQNVEA